MSTLRSDLRRKCCVGRMPPRRTRADNVLLLLADDLSSSDIGALRHLHAPILANTTWGGGSRGLVGCAWTKAWNCSHHRARGESHYLPASLLSVRCCCAHRNEKSPEALAACLRSPFTTAGFAGLPTPALDRLAREGSIVHQAYAPHALCAPARAALLTGRLVSRLAGSTDVDQQAAAIALQRAAARGTTIATRLREQRAFATGFFGKWHLAPLPFVEQYLCSWGGIVEWNATMYDIVKRSVHDAGFEVAEALFPCNLPTMTPNHTRSPHFHSHNPEWIVSHALRFVRASVQQRRRFFATVAFTMPHGPHPHDALELSVERIPGGVERGWPSSEALEMRRAAQERLHATLLGAMGLPDLMRDATKTSLAFGVWWLDHSVGQVLDGLDALNATERTLTVFTADHGREGKWSCNGPGVRVPMLVRWPEVVAAGGVLRRAMMSHIDLLPTVLDAVSFHASQHQESASGAEPAPHIGRSILGALLATPTTTSKAPPERTQVLCETFTDRALTTRTGTLIWRGADPHRPVGRPSAFPLAGNGRLAGWCSTCADPSNATRRSTFTAAPADLPASWSDVVQLYDDATRDPHERVNLRGDPLRQPMLAQLGAVLREAYPYAALHGL